MYECTSETNEAKDMGAMVVRWNMPALIGDRTGKYAVESNDRKDLEAKAAAFCKTGILPQQAP